MDKLLKLTARRMAAHLGALIGALVPIVVQVITHRVGWPEAEALSTGVVVAWLLAMAHISGKLADQLVADLGALAKPGNNGPDLQKLLGDLLSGFGGGQDPLATMTPPPGLASLFPSGQPAQDPAATTVITTPPAGTTGTAAPNV